MNRYASKSDEGDDEIGVQSSCFPKFGLHLAQTFSPSVKRRTQHFIMDLGSVYGVSLGLRCVLQCVRSAKCVWFNPTKLQNSQTGPGDIVFQHPDILSYIPTLLLVRQRPLQLRAEPRRPGAHDPGFGDGAAARGLPSARRAARRGPRRRLLMTRPARPPPVPARAKPPRSSRVTLG